jgi:hypothetical protein
LIFAIKTSLYFLIFVWNWQINHYPCCDGRPSIISQNIIYFLSGQNDWYMRRWCSIVDAVTWAEEQKMQSAHQVLLRFSICCVVLCAWWAHTHHGSSGAEINLLWQMHSINTAQCDCDERVSVRGCCVPLVSSLCARCGGSIAYTRGGCCKTKPCSLLSARCADKFGRRGLPVCGNELTAAPAAILTRIARSPAARLINLLHSLCTNIYTPLTRAQSYQPLFFYILACLL